MQRRVLFGGVALAVVALFGIAYAWRVAKTREAERVRMETEARVQRETFDAMARRLLASALGIEEKEAASLDVREAELLKRAESGDIEARRKLGWAYAFLGGILKRSSRDMEAAAPAHKRQALEEVMRPWRGRYEKGRGFLLEAGKTDPQAALFATFVLHPSFDEDNKDPGAPFPYAATAAKKLPLGAAVLGEYHLYGVGTLKNTAEAFRWFSVAAENGSALGQVRLCKCFSDGVGVAKNLIHAHSWCNVAAVNHSEDWLFQTGRPRVLDASALRGEIEKQMKPSEIRSAEHEAAEWQRRHAGTMRP